MQAAVVVREGVAVVAVAEIASVRIVSEVDSGILEDGRFRVAFAVVVGHQPVSIY